MTTTDDYASIVAKALHDAGARVYMSGGEWRIEVTEEHLRAAVNAVAPLLIEQGRRQVLDELAARMAEPRAALFPLRTVQEFVNRSNR